MKIKTSLLTGRNIALFALQIIVLILSLLIINFVYLRYILPDKSVATTFKEINCTVIDSMLRVKGRWFPRYRADFHVTYIVNDKTYEKWIPTNGLNRSFLDHNSQEDKSRQFVVGQTYTCRYDPENPERIVLAERENWTTIFPLLIPFIISMLMIYFIFRMILRVLGIFPYKKRKKI